MDFRIVTEIVNELIKLLQRHFCWTNNTDSVTHAPVYMLFKASSKVYVQKEDNLAYKLVGLKRSNIHNIPDTVNRDNYRK